MLMVNTHFLLGFFGEDSQPVADHAQDGSEVRQTHQDPEPDQRLVPFIVLYSPVPS